jgi:type II secretory pathway component PulJ
MKYFGNTAGFSLLELLIAASVLLLIAVVLHTTLNKILLSSENLQQIIWHVLSRQRAFALIANDIMSSYSVRQLRQQMPYFMPMITGNSQQVLLTYIDTKQQEGQVVIAASSYFLHNAQLIRRSWPIVPPKAPVNLIIASKLRQISWQYIDQKQQAHHEWPLRRKAAQSLYLVALKLTLVYLNADTTTQIYLLPPRMMISSHA